ncbi:MAG: hypothetical protein WDO24_04515 [Pseudomonadota bacterium]
MSNTTGPCAAGSPNAIGLVPSIGLMPPGGATERMLAAVWRPTRSACAASSM